MKFKFKTKGRITQGYNQNATSTYTASGLSGHPGVDWTLGYGSLIRFDNPGYVYKVWKPQEREDNWAAICQLVPFGDDFMEVTLGHVSAVYVTEGESVSEGQYAGKEGNMGEVYQNGVRITAAMQDAGDTRGSHVHESYRPVRRVRTVKAGKHYLHNKNGRYKDSEGFYYEIINENSTNGCIDPRAFDYEDTRADSLRGIMNALLKLKITI